jgi:hypothetical protein
MAILQGADNEEVARALVRTSFVRSLNHSATVNPKLRETHCLLGRQRVSGRDDMEVFGRRDGDLDFPAVMTRDCRPPAAGLALVSIDNIRLINNHHESCFSARAQARWASLDCTIANVGRPRASVHCVAQLSGLPRFNAERPGLEQGFNVGYCMGPTQTATSRLLLLAAARFCEVVGPNAIQRCRGVPDRIHLRA